MDDEVLCLMAAKISPPWSRTRSDGAAQGTNSRSGRSSRELRQFVHSTPSTEHFVVGGGRACCTNARSSYLSSPAGSPIRAAAASARSAGGPDLRPLLRFPVRVPDDAERARPLTVAWEQAADEQPGGLFQRDQPPCRPSGGVRMKRSILPGMRINAFIGLSDPRQLQRHGEAELGMNGKGCAGPTSAASAAGRYCGGNGPRSRCARFGDVAAVNEDNANVGEDGTQVAPDRLLVAGEPGNRLVDEDELLGGA